MGGRRAVSLSQVLGSTTREPKLEARLHSALRRGEPEEIADVSSALAARVLSPAEAANYLALFVPFVREHLTKPLPPQDLRASVREEWTHLKSKHDLNVKGVLNDAVVQSVLDLLRMSK